MTNKMIAKMVRQVLEEKEIEQEYLSEKIRTSCQLAEYNYAVQEIHFPKNRENMILARRRLVFDEFLIFLLSVRHMKETVKNEKNLFGIKPVSETEALIQSLPYSLTNAQKKVWQEIQRCGEWKDNSCVSGNDIVRTKWISGSTYGSDGSIGSPAF